MTLIRSLEKLANIWKSEAQSTCSTEREEAKLECAKDIRALLASHKDGAVGEEPMREPAASGAKDCPEPSAGHNSPTVSAALVEKAANIINDYQMAAERGYPVSASKTAIAVLSLHPADETNPNS